MDITVSNKQLNPAVIHTNQFSNGEYKVVFKFDDYVQNGVDLRDKKVYVITSYYGTPDIMEVTSTVVGTKLEVTWDIDSKTLENDGVVQYQLRFSESGIDGTAVWYSYKGLLIVRESIDVDNHTSANYPTLLQQMLNKIEQISGNLDAAVFYMEPGNSIPVVERTSNRLYYQIVDSETNEGYFEDHTGKKLGCYDVEYVTDPNLDSMLNDGEYVCYFTSGSISYGFLKVCKSHSCDRIFQYFQYIEGNTCRIKSRVITVSGNSTTTGAWSEMATRLDVTNEVATYNSGLLGAKNVPVCVDGNGKLAPASVTNTELDYLSGVTSNIQAQLNGKQSTITGAATTVTSTNLTTSRVLISNTSGKIAASSVTNTELGYLSGVTSNVQTQLNEKQSKITGAASTITGTTLAKSMALVSNSDGNVAVSDITSTELGYLDGATSNIQTQLNGKASTEFVNGARLLNYSKKYYRLGNFSGYVSLDPGKTTEITIPYDCMLYMNFYVGSSDGTIETVTLKIDNEDFDYLLISSGLQVVCMPFKKDTNLKFISHHSIQLKLIYVPFN